MTKIFATGLALLLMIGLTTVEAAEPSSGCARSLQYRCSVTDGRSAMDLGIAKMNDVGGSVLVNDNNPSGYRLAVTIGTMGSRTIMTLSVVDPTVSYPLANSVVYYGSEMAMVEVSARGHRYGATFSCVQEDRFPDADGRQYVVNQAPPAKRPENVPPRRGYVFVPSAFENYNGTWTLKPGYWQREKANAVFEAGDWFFCDGRFRWADARWVNR